VSAPADARSLDARNIAEFDDLWAHERMLADGVRVDAYARAFARQIGRNDVVLDLGTGSGILGFLAARHAKKVYAVDHSGVIEVARAVAEANGIANVEFVRSNSRDFTAPEPIDVILNEQIGDELFEENMIENVVDLRTRLLRPGGRILPARIALYLEPVMLRDGYDIPFIWEMSVDGIDFRSLRDRPEIATLPRSGDLRWVHRLEVDRLLCDPAPLYTVDLGTVQARELPTAFAAERTATRTGRLDGLFVYVGVDFGDGIRFDTSPRRARAGAIASFIPARRRGRRSARVPDRPEARDRDAAVMMTQPAFGRTARIPRAGCSGWFVPRRPLGLRGLVHLFAAFRLPVPSPASSTVRRPPRRPSMAPFSTPRRQAPDRLTA
jgi:protein arginine N-methyltransferase 1